MKNTIAQNMIKILNNNHRNNVWYGDVDLIEECARISGVFKHHPQLTIQCVLNALDRSNLFVKGYINADINGRKKKYRCFSIRS